MSVSSKQWNKAKNMQVSRVSAYLLCVCKEIVIPIIYSREHHLSAYDEIEKKMREHPFSLDNMLHSW